MDPPSTRKKKPDGFYTYSSFPRPVPDRSRKGEPPSAQTRTQYGNLMYDRHVVRGNTYSKYFTPPTALPDPAEKQRQQEIRRRATASKRAKEQLRSGTPEAVQGRKHIVVQTERYLEELSEIVVTTDIGHQTDDLLDKPASPIFIPAKTGKDAATQVEEAELFDFDREVQPVLDFLVAKVIERSLEEVKEEEELACLKARQRAFRELRNAELAKAQMLEEEERRRIEEKNARIAEEREMLKIQKETVEKIAARAYAQEYLADLVPSVFASLRSHGYFYDPVERDIETNFFPCLMAEVDQNLEKRKTARELLDSVIYDVTQMRLESFEELEDQPAESENAEKPQ